MLDLPYTHPAAATQVLAMAQRPLAATRLDPWCQPILQHRLALMRLSAVAASAITAAAPCSSPAAAQQLVACGSTPFDIAGIDAALAVLAIAPPGAEPLALQALDHALSPHELEAILSIAQSALDGFAVRPEMHMRPMRP